MKNEFFTLAKLKPSVSSGRTFKIWLEPGCDGIELQPPAWISLLSSYDSRKFELNMDRGSENWDLTLYTDNVSGLLENGTSWFPCLSCGDPGEKYSIDERISDRCSRKFRIRNATANRISLFLPQQKQTFDIYPGSTLTIICEGRIGDVPEFIFDGETIFIDSVTGAIEAG